MKRLNLNSSNSSKPLSLDPNRERKSNGKGNRKPGGQIGRRGKRLNKVKNPDEIKIIQIDKTSLPPGKYKEEGYETRQVIHVEVKRKVTEYRAQILVDENGKKFTAPFPVRSKCQCSIWE